MFGVPGVRVLAAERERGGGLLLTVETDRQLGGCHGCGVLAVPHGRREHLLHDAPVRASPGPGGVAQAGVALPGAGVSDGDVHRGARPGAAAGVVDPPGGDVGRGRTVRRRHHCQRAGPPAGRRLHTLWAGLKLEARRRADDPERLTGVESLGVDEHIWRPGKFGAGREVTCMVDLTRDANGKVRARLLDLVLGRSGLRRLARRPPA